MFLDLDLLADYLKPIWPHMILIIAALIVPAIGMRSRRAAAGFILGASAFAAFVTAWMMYDGYSGVFESMYAFNDFTALMIMLFLVMLCLITMMSFTGSESRNHAGEYFALLSVATVGMMLVCTAEDLISLFIGLELANIMTVALVAFKKNDPRSSEAAVKYLITGGISTALFLYGMSLVYGLTGTMNINDIVVCMAGAGLTWTYILAAVTLIAGFAFKISLIPFHSWVPDVYEGAPTSVTNFLAVSSKSMGFIVFFKMFLLLFVAYSLTHTSGVHELQWIFALLAAGTMTLGNIVAISQTSIKRMLAYSSIAQAGYVIIAVAVATEDALMGGLFYVIVHAFMKGGAFMVVGALCARGISENISDYRGLARRAPLVAFAMMLFLFSLAGIPPLAGFDAKFVLFSSAVTAADGMWIWLVVIAVINSAISLYYYARVVKAMYIDKGTTERLKVPFSYKVPIAICAIAVILIGVYPMEIIKLCEQAADVFITLFRTATGL